jgi:hypothetical protein
MCPICHRPVVRGPSARPGGEMTHDGCVLRPCKPLAVCPPPPCPSSRIRRSATGYSPEPQPRSRGTAFGGSSPWDMKTHLPSIEALVASDHGVLDQELRWLAVREQAARVRALAERIECVAARPGSAEAPLVEELGRLGCRALEAAASMSKKVDAAPESGWRDVQSAARK